MLSVRTIVGRISHPTLRISHKKSIAIDDQRWSPTQEGCPKLLQWFGYRCLSFPAKHHRKRETEQHSQTNPSQSQPAPLPFRPCPSDQAMRQNIIGSFDVNRRERLFDRILHRRLSSDLSLFGWQKDRKVMPLGNLNN